MMKIYQKQGCLALCFEMQWYGALLFVRDTFSLLLATHSLQIILLLRKRHIRVSEKSNRLILQTRENMKSKASQQSFLSTLRQSPPIFLAYSLFQTKAQWAMPIVLNHLFFSEKRSNILGNGTLAEYVFNNFYFSVTIFSCKVAIC